MEDFLIEATKHTPNISFDADHNTFEIKGKSYPENTVAFYQPFFEFLDSFLEKLKDQESIFNIELFYFNSSSSKILMDFFDILDEAAGAGKNITVNWIYNKEDEDTLEYGEEFQEDMQNLMFNLLEKAEER